MKRVKVAVVGYGHLGKWHCQKVEALSDMADFVAIVERTQEGQELAKVQHPKVNVVSDIKDIIHEIDAAIIVTPTSTHFELVQLLLSHDKHVFCEKPVCSNDFEAKKLRAVAAQKNVVIQVGHSERFHEAWENLRKKFHDLVPPFSVRIHRVAPFKGRATDVDVIQDLGIHDLDLLCYLFKQKPREIKASGYKIRTKNLDYAIIQVNMDEGCDATIVVGRNAVKETRDLEVISSDGVVSVDLFSNKIYEATKSSFEDGSFVKEVNYSKRDHLLLEHKNFYLSILNETSPLIGLNEGINAVHLVDCALKSVETQNSIKVSSFE